MTVEELAQQLGVTVKEALALCLVAGVKAKLPTSRLTAADVEAIRRVLAGEKKMVDPTRPGAGDDKPRHRRPALITGAVVVALLLLAGGAIVTFGLGGKTAITVKAGECFDALLLGTTVFGTSIEPKPCDDANYQAFAVLELDAVWDSWPGVDAVEARARDRCLAIADQGEVLAWNIYYFGPADELAWSNPEARKIVCAVAA